MKESDFIKTTNRVKLFAARNLLADTFPQTQAGRDLLREIICKVETLSEMTSYVVEVTEE